MRQPERRFAYGDASVHNALPPRVVFGIGAVSQLAAEVGRLGARRVLVLSTAGRAGMAGRIVEALGDRCIGLLAEAVSQVPIELAEAGRRKALAAGADCLVSFGGGAAVGLGKGIALGIELPIIAVPTTYSGSEMTGFCGITIAGVKRMHQSPHMLARTVIYDPELTVSLPVSVSAASAMNALAHCVESVYVPTGSPINACAGVEGAHAIADALPRLLAQPDDLIARSDLLYGAYLGGAALTAGFALQHGIAHVLGGSFGIEHGLAHALVLPHVTAYNAQFAPRAVGRIADAIGAPDAGQGLFDLLAEIGLPTSLAELGIRHEQLDAVVRITLETDHGNNPGPIGEAAIRSILDNAFEGRRPSTRL
jgi:maleylacetate reductase